MIKELMIALVVGWWFFAPEKQNPYVSCARVQVNKDTGEASLPVDMKCVCDILDNQQRWWEEWVPMYVYVDAHKVGMKEICQNRKFLDDGFSQLGKGISMFYLKVE